MARKKNKSEIAEIAELARSVGLSYGMYVGYLESNYLNHYLRMRFQQESERNADDVIVHHSNIIGAYYGKAKA